MKTRFSVWLALGLVIAFGLWLGTADGSDGTAPSDGSVSFDPQPSTLPIVSEMTNSALIVFGGIVLTAVLVRQARRALLARRRS